MIRRTSCEVLLCASVYYAAGITAFDGWICRVDVIRVGADLRVRPQNRLRSGEDGAVSKVSPQRKEEVRESCIFRCLFLELNSCISV